jgi:hypothetical protein
MKTLLKIDFLKWILTLSLYRQGEILLTDKQEDELLIYFNL